MGFNVIGITSLLIALLALSYRNMGDLFLIIFSMAIVFPGAHSLLLTHSYSLTLTHSLLLTHLLTHLLTYLQDLYVSLVSLRLASPTFTRCNLGTLLTWMTSTTTSLLMTK
jgi:hypothetical protein